MLETARDGTTSTKTDRLYHRVSGLMEAFFAGLIGFLIGKGVAPADAQSIVKALETYLGFEPPLGLTGYALMDMPQGEKKNTSVVIRGKTYNAIALNDISKHSQISVLGRKGAYLEVAPLFKTITIVAELSSKARAEIISLIKHIGNFSFETGDLTSWHDDSEVVTVTTDKYLEGKHSAYLPKEMKGNLTQHVSILSNKVNELRFWWLSGEMEKEVRVKINYTDGESTTGDFGSDQTTPIVFKHYGLTPVADKTINKIVFTTKTTNDHGYLDCVELVMN